MVQLARRRCDYVECRHWFQPRNPRARFCCPAHRAAQWKLDNAYGPQRPVRTPLRRRRGGPSGRSIRISYFKAVNLVALELAARLMDDDPSVTYDRARRRSVETAREILAPTLTNRARALLRREEAP